MVSMRHSQSLKDFRQKATQTLDRLRETGEAEVLTVNGEARAVLMSPAAHAEFSREVELSRDVAVMRQSIKELEQGKGQEASIFFRSLRTRLKKMQAKTK